MIVNPLPQMQGGSFTPGYGGGGTRQVQLPQQPNMAMSQPQAMIMPGQGGGGMAPPAPGGGMPMGGMNPSAGPGIDFSKLQGGMQINHPQMGMQGAMSNQTSAMGAQLAHQQALARYLRQ